MNANEVGPFLALLVQVADYYNQTLSESQQEMYLDLLRDYDLGAIRHALHTHARRSKWMPKANEIIELMPGTGPVSVEDEAMQAWLTVQEAMRRVGRYRSLVCEDPAVGLAIQRVFGSWPSLCETRDRVEEATWMAKRKEWMAAYRRERGAAVGPVVCHGLHELHNGSVRTDLLPDHVNVGLLHGDGRVRNVNARRDQDLAAALAIPPPVRGIGHVLAALEPEDQGAIVTHAIEAIRAGVQTLAGAKRFPAPGSAGRADAERERVDEQDPPSLAVSDPSARVDGSADASTPGRHERWPVAHDPARARDHRSAAAKPARLGQLPGRAQAGARRPPKAGRHPRRQPRRD